MRRTITIILVCTIFCLVFPIAYAADNNINTIRHSIEITNTEMGLSITEDIEVNNTEDENCTSVQYWIQLAATEKNLQAIEAGKDLPLTTAGNIHKSNLSKFNLTIQPEGSLTFRLTYTLPTNTEYFEKKLLHDTKSLTVTFNKRDIYLGQHLTAESTIQLQLYQPSEAPLNTIYIAIILILVIILIASTLLILRKQRTRVKETIVESEELLTLKKTLLLSILKDIEKQYRAKTLSDDTYNKLKEEFKQQAVDVMKKLEDINK